jgi:uncharacterized protein (TIGR00730 family)
MRVTVFGGARPTPPHYQDAYRLGQLLGQAGHTVLTGGYVGTMEAVSRGANEAGAHVIGVTCEEIENWRKVGPNAWVREELRFRTLRERLYALLEQSDAAIALPGGAGTLTEITMLWNHLLIRALPPRKLILIGAAWQKTFQALFTAAPEYYSTEDQAWLLFAPDVESAARMLAEDVV